MTASGQGKGWLRTQLERTDTPFGYTVLAAFLALAVPSGIQIYQIYDQNRSSAEDHAKRELATDLRSLQLEMANLSTLVNAFAYPLIAENRLDEKNRELVVRSLVEQQSRVNQIKPFLAKDGRELADAYQATLLNVRDKIRNVDDRAALGAVYRDLLEMLKVQEKLVAEIQGRAGLLEIASTEP